MGRHVPTRRTRATASVKAGCQRTGPLLVRPKSQVGGACSPDRGRPCSSSTIDNLGQADPEALVARIDRALAAGFGILDHKQADIRQSELARIEDLDRDDLASAPKPGKRRTPGLGRRDEVRDHDGESTASQHASEAVDGSTEIDLSL